MPDRTTRIGTLALAVLVVVSVIAPAAAGVAAEESLAVTTAEPTDVTDNSATLQGNLTDLGNATNAAVSFEYWQAGDSSNVTTVDAGELNETGEFEAPVDGLEPNTSYTYVAIANASDNVTTVAAEETFTTEEEPTVRTNEPSDVTNASATLHGELVDLEGADNATVWFEYEAEDDNVTATEGQTLNDTGAFQTIVDGLESNTSYTYVAYAQPADGEAEAGSEVTFDTRSDDLDDENDSFGQFVSAFVHSLFGETVDGPFGASVSEWVTSNNPANDNKPGHAGPDSDRGATDSDNEPGPPAHANNDKGDEGDGEAENENESEDDGAENEEESEEDDERGPPEHANNDKGDEDDGEDG